MLVSGAGYAPGVIPKVVNKEPETFCIFATLLAAAHITNLPITSSSKFESKLQSKQRGCQSVAIEISHNGIVNRDDIIKDFETRSLPPPTDIIRGDCTLTDIRDQARMAI